MENYLGDHVQDIWLDLSYWNELIGRLISHKSCYISSFFFRKCHQPFFFKFQMSLQVYRGLRGGYPLPRSQPLPTPKLLLPTDFPRPDLTVRFDQYYRPGISASDPLFFLRIRIRSKNQQRIRILVNQLQIAWKHKKKFFCVFSP